MTNDGSDREHPRTRPGQRRRDDLDQLVRPVAQDQAVTLVDAERAAQCSLHDSSAGVGIAIDRDLGERTAEFGADRLGQPVWILHRVELDQPGRRSDVIRGDRPDFGTDEFGGKLLRVFHVGDSSRHRNARQLAGKELFGVSSFFDRPASRRRAHARRDLRHAPASMPARRASARLSG
jgi:hypothetical protein